MTQRKITPDIQKPTRVNAFPEKIKYAEYSFKILTLDSQIVGTLKKKKHV